MFTKALLFVLLGCVFIHAEPAPGTVDDVKKYASDLYAATAEEVRRDTQKIKDAYNSAASSASKKADELYEEINKSVKSGTEKVKNAYATTKTKAVNAWNSLVAKYTDIKETLDGTKEQKRRNDLENAKKAYEAKLNKRQSQGEAERQELQEKLNALVQKQQQLTVEKNIAEEKEIEDVTALYREYQAAVDEVAKKTY